MNGVAALVDPAARRFGATPRMPDRPPRCRAVAPTNEIPATARHPRDTCIRAPPHTARTHAWRFPPQRNAPLAVAPNVAAHGGPPPRRNTFSQLRRTARRAGAARRRARRQTNESGASRRVSNPRANCGSGCGTQPF
ncbi:hypothetical protein X961_5104 [Burkholderia pseudomallei MSHR5613]|nr:hypothetical protein X961_5104 [Burkholderia pseudomallei MSHR5613]